MTDEAVGRAEVVGLNSEGADVETDAGHGLEIHGGGEGRGGPEEESDVGEIGFVGSIWGLTEKLQKSKTKNLCTPNSKHDRPLKCSLKIFILKKTTHHWHMNEVPR